MSTQRCYTVKLELLRAGPVHGQLLSPLTPYLALCGDEGPVTFNVPFEHYRFRNRLLRLRYLARSRESGVTEVPDTMRAAEIDELGRDVGEVLGGIPTLTSELGRATRDNSELSHLRIIISGAELALIPFEALISPQGYPGEGLPLALQTSTPITITREVRRGHTRDFQWDREPNILFIEASPDGLEVPMREHLLALRTALDAWIPWKSDPQVRVAEVRKRLTVLLDASLPEIESACLSNQFTHVHILAHGAKLDDESELRYGLVLCDPNDKSRPMIVEGQPLAAALAKSSSHSGAGRSAPPLVVSLATCDSGNVGGVVFPGGSLAHVLQAFGIPWVFASQFPLTKRGSVRMTEKLYEDLLSGEDPRKTLRCLRETLHINARQDHDWASVVGYVTMNDGFDVMVDSLWTQHKRRLADRDMERSEALLEQLWVTTDSEQVEALKSKVEGHLADAESRFARWSSRFPVDDGSKARRELRAEWLGLQGAIKKRVAEIHFRVGQPTSDWRRDLESALGFYSEALDVDWTKAHWQVTQYLSLVAVLGREADLVLFGHAFRWAEKDLQTEPTTEARAWAHGTLSELEMLRLYHDPSAKSLKVEEIIRRTTEHCREIVRLMGIDSFHVLSTRRQFKRYRDWWQVADFKPIVEAALNALSETPSARGSERP